MLNNEKVAAMFDRIHDEFYQLKISEIDEIRDEIIALVRADEREACARLCDIAVENFTSISLQVDDDDGIVMEHANTCSHLAAAIRARGQA